MFVGCDSNLVAPVNRRGRPVVRTGVQLLRNVPGNPSQSQRARQVNKENYVQKLNFKN